MIPLPASISPPARDAHLERVNAPEGDECRCPDCLKGYAARDKAEPAGGAS